MIRRILATSTIIVFCVLVYLIFDLWQQKNHQETRVYAEGEQSILALKEGIDDILKDVMKASESFARKMETLESNSRTDLERMIVDQSLSSDGILGVTVAFEPYGFDEATALYSPYFDRKQNKIIHVENVYNYTDPELDTAQWYVQVRDNGEQWVEPYYAKAAQALVSDYGVPFYYLDGPKKGQIRGTVTTTISLSGFTDIVQKMSLGKTGFGFVSSEKGLVVAHPIREYVGVKNIANLKEEQENTAIKKAYSEILKKDKGDIKSFDKPRNQKSLFLFDKIDATNWRIAGIFYYNDILGTDNTIKRKAIRLCLVIGLLCFLLITIYFNRDFLSVAEMWQLSVLASCILSSNIIFIGYLQHKDTHDLEKLKSPPIADQTQVGKVIQSENNTARLRSVGFPINRPVGIHIEGIEFKDSYNLNMSGRVWIKYKGDLPAEEKLGFYFPQTAPFAESSYLEESYRKILGNQTLIVYEFRHTIRLNFDYSDYPFDKRHIALELQPKHNTYEELFVPDLEAYLYRSPSQKNGISEDIRIPGSKILESYFSYKNKTPNTRFGESLSDNAYKPASLYFNINIQRNLVTASVTYLIPIFISLTMIFILLYSAEKSSDTLAGGGIIQGLAAFFFVLVFSHIDLRKDLLTGELVYMEYYYFIAYLMIIFCAINLIIYTRMNNPFFNYKNNIIVKTVFWPTFFTILLVTTLFKFY